MTAADRPSPPRVRDALETLRVERAAAWEALAAAHTDLPADVLARSILDDPSAHPWRLVDAALERSHCAACRNELGAGPRGCPDCDMADGFRFSAREADRPGVPPGNDHAIRVSSAVLRAPQRYPAWTVRGNELFLPLFMAGAMPRREIKARLDRALRAAGAAPRLEAARDFDELLALAEAAAGR